MSRWKRIKEALKRYLEQLGTSNKELFGSGRPDCCTLNKQGIDKRKN
ncbi:hypothetical protein SDC9_56659 [bioreactor metagenome]|uniref:Uncharacterized protein n=1 Tax=bioreactor metagenome TaxID=1076179 RepID=A0A644X2G1_9ZZZZ